MNSILLVDDSGLFRAVTDKIQRRTHCRLLLAGNGSEALAVARRAQPDLIFVDGDMKDMSGIDVSRVLKADPPFAHTPIVVVSEREPSPEESRRAAAAAWLTKPLDENAIFDCIRRFLQVSPRDAERSSVGWPITFWRDGTQHEGALRDLSRGGFYIRTPVRQPVGARLEISFEVPGEKAGRTVVGEAIVVRIGQEPDRGLGCRFFRLTAGPRAVLDECLRTLESETAAGERRQQNRGSR
jgi:CheY-like chemotaxis protein